MSDSPVRSVLLYGGERDVRLEIARHLREHGVRVLLASSPPEAAKAMSAGTVRVIGALSPLTFTAHSPPDGTPPVVVNDVEMSLGAGRGHAAADALAWAERIRQKLVEPRGQPTSSA